MEMYSEGFGFKITFFRGFFCSSRGKVPGWGGALGGTGRGALEEKLWQPLAQGLRAENAAGGRGLRAASAQRVIKFKHIFTQ